MNAIRCSLVVLLSLVLVGLGRTQEGKDKKDEKKAVKKAKVLEVGKGIDISDKLGDKDGKDTEKNGCYCKVYLVKMVKGKNYQIDMSSSAFDAFLRLEDNKSKQLAEDDDSGGGDNGLDAQILFTPTEDGVFRVIATSFNDGETGSFRLKIQVK